MSVCLFKCKLEIQRTSNYSIISLYKCYRVVFLKIKIKPLAFLYFHYFPPASTAALSNHEKPLDVLTIANNENQIVCFIS